MGVSFCGRNRLQLYNISKSNQFLLVLYSYSSTDSSRLCLQGQLIAQTSSYSSKWLMALIYEIGSLPSEFAPMLEILLFKKGSREIDQNQWHLSGKNR